MKSTHQIIAEQLTRLYRKGKPIRITSELADKLMRRYAKQEVGDFIKWCDIPEFAELYKLFKQQNP